MNLQIYRNNSPHIQIPIDKNTFFSQVVMGEHIISSSFISPTPIDIDEGDYVIFRGERFTINKPLPPIDKNSNSEFSYSLVFEGAVYDLNDTIFKHLGSLEFSNFLTAKDWIQLVVDCANSIGEGWSVGEVDETEEMLIDFYANGEGFSCKGALIKVAETFGLEFWLTGKTINLTKQAGVLTNLDFEYGRGKGLYTITRGEIQDQKYFNRIYGQGSTKNIPFGYRNGAKRLTLPELYLEVPLPAGKRRKEGSVILDDIFPKRTGALTGVSADWLSITDTSLDFDLNGLRIDGETPKVSFTTGENAGREFEIDSYNHTTKTIKLKPLVEADGYTYPNSTFAIAVGDKYVLLGIEMPIQYVTAAESELRTEMQKLLNKAINNTPPYNVVIDPKYMRDNGIRINAGDRARLKDAGFILDRIIRVNSVKFPIPDPNEIEVVLSDIIIYTSSEKRAIEADKIVKEVTVVNRVNAEKARSNMVNLRRLQTLTFDPDGYFDPERIKPQSIETWMLSVGAKSQNFSLNGVTINTNTLSDPNHLTVSQGALIHYEVQIEGLGYVWQMASAEFPALDPAKEYFLSAKCRTTALTGEWFLSETPMTAESEAGYYHFNLGVLYSVGSDDVRGFDFTNGMTFITGDRITTGRIQSLDGLNWFDLTGNSFRLGDLLSGIDWNVTTPGKLTISGDIVATDANFINLTVANIRTGKVRITEAEDNIKIINTLNDDDLIVIDDDGADEGGYTTSLTPPLVVNVQTGALQRNYLGITNISGVNHYMYANIGPGISVGVSPTDANGYSTIGRKYIKTTGSVEAGSPDGAQLSVMKKTGITTTGFFQADGLSNLNDINIAGNIGLGLDNGETIELDVRVGGDVFWKMKWKKGILISAVKIP